MKQKLDLVARIVFVAGAVLSPPVAAWSQSGSVVRVPEMVYEPFFREEGEGSQTIGPLEVDRFPVTNSDYARFLKDHPKWTRSQVKQIFAGESYLAHWSSDHSFDAALADRPVTHVTWFAARAYCKSQGGRLLTVAEWEGVSDAQNPEILKQILEWYSRPTASEEGALKSIAGSKPNKFGIHGMHGMIWEWVEDYSSVIISGDSRSSNDSDKGLFCGGASLRAKDPAQYATFMRYAHRSSLSAAYSGSTLGFRCTR